MDYDKIEKGVLNNIRKAREANRKSALEDAFKKIANHENELLKLREKISLAKNGDWSKLVNEWEYNIILDEHN